MEGLLSSFAGQSLQLAGFVGRTKAELVNRAITRANMNFPFADVEHAINGLRSKLQRASSESLQDEFDAGLHPNLLSYGKLQTVGTSLPVLDKYLVGASSYLHQPSNYYDIFGVCRCLIIVQLLNAALDALQSK